MKKDAKIAILGYGIEGQALILCLRKKGFKNLTVCEQKESLEKIPSGVKTRLGKNYLKNLIDFEIVFRSPGVRFLEPEIQKARRKGVKITSLTQFFLEKCPALVIGVTGTKGKGTTASLIYEILKRARKIEKFEGKVFLGGNIGEPPLSFLDRLAGKDAVILELSSFQLQDLRKSPQIAVVLQVKSDHLDYHQTEKEYQTAKLGIVRQQTAGDYLIINQDYLSSRFFLKKSPARVFTVSTKREVERGAFIKKGDIFLKIKGKKGKICSVKEVGLLGPHNLENILPAVVAAGLFRVKIPVIREVVKKFKNLPHRLEFVREVKGIKFYNDSYSTTPETAIAAVRSFEQPLILIAGGSEKYSDFTPLAQELVTRRNLKAVILMGKTAERLEKAIKKAGKEAARPLKIIRAADLKQAFSKLRLEAKKGDIVLLSPACASFDLFKNYQERGEVFKKLVANFGRG